MIRLSKKTEQDFLSLKWCKRLKKAGIDMSIDAKYWIIHRKYANEDRYYVIDTATKNQNPASLEPPVPTYTLPELLYKLHEWLYKDDVDAPLSFMKDAPFYGFYYKGHKIINGERTRLSGNNDPFNSTQSFLEYPIDSAATLLLWCIENNYGYVKDISDK